MDPAGSKKERNIKAAFLFLLIFVSTLLSAQELYFYAINDNSVRIRKSPTTKSEILTLVGVNNYVLVSSISQTKENVAGVEGSWASVYYNGIEGYIFSAFLGEKLPGIAIVPNKQYFDIQLDSLGKSISKVTFRISYDPIHNQLVFITDTSSTTHDLGNLKVLNLDNGKEILLGKSLSYIIPSDYSQIIFDTGADKPWLTMNLISKSLVDFQQLFQFNFSKLLRQKNNEADATTSWKLLNDSTLFISINGQVQKRYECTVLLQERKLNVSYFGEEK